MSNLRVTHSMYLVLYWPNLNIQAHF